MLDAGAYTQVDQAVQAEEVASAINSYPPSAFAEVLAKTGGHLLQISTDFVFKGDKSSPYEPEDPVDPLGAYGRTKALGEKAILKTPGLEKRRHILRTSWLYGPTGKNFCLTMLRMHYKQSKINKPFGVVADQIGSPTSTHSLAKVCWELIKSAEAGKQLPEILHWSDAGMASWYEFAIAIGELGVKTGLINSSASIFPLKTNEYPTAAKRPSYSVLGTSKTSKLLAIQANHWRKELTDVLEAIPKHDRWDN